MTIEKNISGTCAELKLVGRLDTTTAPELEMLADQELGAVNALVLDMSALEYISSAGLRVLLKMQKLMGVKGGMKLTNVNESVMEVFEITGFADILTIE